MYTIQHYVIKFVSDLQQVVVSSTNKTDCHNIAEILLKVALNTINQLKIRFGRIFKEFNISFQADDLDLIKFY
jgi:hypothetical protein